MESANQMQEGKSLEADKKKKGGFWNGFVNFLMMGGFLVILVAIVAIVILIERLMK
jgi:hypothetical protein